MRGCHSLVSSSTSKSATRSPCWLTPRHVERYGHPSKFGYKDICNLWKAERWDPEKLIRLYQRAGARYFVALANHHCNFDCWYSRYQPWNSVNVGPRRDIVGTWAELARKHGLYKTLGWPEDTWALNEEKIDEEVFLEDLHETFDQQRPPRPRRARHDAAAALRDGVTVHGQGAAHVLAADRPVAPDVQPAPGRPLRRRDRPAPVPWIIPVIFLQPILATAFFPAGFAGLAKVGSPHIKNVAVSLTVPLGFLIGGGAGTAGLGLAGEAKLFYLGFIIFGGFICGGAGLVRYLNLADDKK